MQEKKDRPASRWAYIIVVLCAALTVVGALVSKIDPSLLTNGHAVPTAAHIYTDYMFSRSIALAALMLFFLCIGARRMLAVCMLLLTLIQCIDVIDDAGRGDFMLVPGVLVLMILCLVAARSLLDGPLWRPAAWRDRP